MSSLINLNANSWKEVLSIAIQGVVIVLTIGLPPWFGYKTFLRKNNIENAVERLTLKTAELDKIRKISKAAEVTIEIYQEKVLCFQESLLNIQARVETALEFNESFQFEKTELNKEIIEQTPSTVINHLSVLNHQIQYQQQQLNSYHTLFQEILVFATIKEDE